MVGWRYNSLESLVGGLLWNQGGKGGLIPIYFDIMFSS